MITFVCTPSYPTIMSTVAMGTVHFRSAIDFIFEDKNSLHLRGPNERFGTYENLSCGVARCVKLAPGVLVKCEHNFFILKLSTLNVLISWIIENERTQMSLLRKNVKSVHVDFLYCL